MHDPYFDYRLTPDAIPPLARLLGAALPLVFIGVVVLSAIVTSA